MPSVTRSSRPRSTSATDNREQALYNAMETLLAQGDSFTTVSVEALARQAGMARSTFYLHFRDKGELVARLMTRVTDEIIQAASLWFDAPGKAEPEGLETAIRGIAGVYERHRAIMQAVVETAAYDLEVARLFRDMMDTLRAENRHTVARAQAAGLIGPAVTGEVVDVLTWTIERNCHQLLGGGAAHRERVIAAMVHVARSALYASGPAAS